MGYQELVGPLPYMQARSVYGDHPLTMLKPRSYAHMTVRDFYESRYCAEGTRGVFFYLNSVFVDLGLMA
eukprot:1285310-Prorocentrum_lima.AAC.1